MYTQQLKNFLDKVLSNIINASLFRPDWYNCWHTVFLRSDENLPVWSCIEVFSTNYWSTHEEKTCFMAHFTRYFCNYRFRFDTTTQILVVKVGESWYRIRSCINMLLWFNTFLFGTPPIWPRTLFLGVFWVVEHESGH